MKNVFILTVIAAVLIVGCQQVAVPEPLGCTADVQECSDGSFVARNPNNNCEFNECPEGCAKDLRVCDDGTTVSRDLNNNCEFNPCPGKRYVNTNTTLCDSLRFTCNEGEQAFHDETGCGCEEIKVCTKELMACPDGTAVSRNPANNCEFDDCSTNLGMQVDRRYVERDSDTCKLVDFVCIEGAKPFFDNTGCGCEPVESIKYMSNSTATCATIKYACANNSIPFSDETGCGCMFDWGGQLPPEEPTKTFCEPDQRNSICTKEYNPVCGWFGQDVQCIKYPCAQDMGNACSACADPKVEYYTVGRCPQ